MSDRNLVDEWRLEEDGKAQEQWKLQTTEQELSDQWQLQDEQGRPVRPAQWQPVDYTREPAPGGNGGWVLSSLVGVALIAVVGYAVWIGLNRFGIAPTVTVSQSEQPVVPVPTVADVEIAPVATTAPTQAPQAEPTATPLPPTPTVAPTPVIPTIALQYVTITNTLGVNARVEPSTQAEVIRIAQFNEKFLIAAERPDGWLQIALPPNQLAWIRIDNAQRTTESAPLDQANQRRAQAGLPPLLASAAQVVAAAGVVSNTAPLTTTTGLTVTAGLSETTTISEDISGAIADGTTVSNSIPLSVTGEVTATAPVAKATVAITGATSEMTATITAQAGLNVRADPNPNGVLITFLQSAQTATALARTDDSQWIQLRLADKRTGWAAAQFIALSGDIKNLPTPTSLADIAGPGAITATVALTNTGTKTSTQLTVTSVSGAKGRAKPSVDTPATKLLPFNTVLTAIARSADNLWVKVQPTTGDALWILTETVTLSVQLESLPVAQ